MQLTYIQELLNIRNRRKARMRGHLQYLTSFGMTTIELADMVRKSLVCSEAYVEANRAALLSVDTLKQVVTADVEPHFVYEFWVPDQNHNHENRVLAYIEVVRIQGNVKVMVKDVAIKDNTNAEDSDTPEIHRTVGGLHISLDAPEWLKGEEMAMGNISLPPVEFKNKYYFES